MKADLQTFEYAYGRVTGFGLPMKVLEPQELQKDIQALAKEIIGLYE